MWSLARWRWMAGGGRNRPNISLVDSHFAFVFSG
jgi:hypothetical protein